MRYTLSDREVSFLSQIIYRIYSTDSYEQISEMVLQQLQVIIPFRKGIIFQIRWEDNKRVFQNPIVLNPADLSYDEDTFMVGSYRPNWLSYAASPWSYTFLQTDIRDEQTFLNSPLYRDIYIPQNIYYGIHSILIHQGQSLALLGLFRAKDAGDFSDRDLFILTELSKHLELRFFTLLEHETSSDEEKLECSSNFFQQEDFKNNMIDKYNLTKREAEISYLIMKGYENADILSSLFISKSTLDKHLYNIYQKMGVKSRTALQRSLHQINGTPSCSCISCCPFTSK